MWAVLAVALGVGLGLATGRPANLAAHRLRWWPLAVAGALAQAIGAAVGIGGGSGLALVLASDGVLAVFIAANLRLAGMGLVALGLALNMVVIAANDGMPVRVEAAAAAGADPNALASRQLGAKRQLEEADDVLVALGDVVPVRRLGEVLSVGDLLMAAGVVGALTAAFHPPPASPEARPRHGPDWLRSASPLRGRGPRRPRGPARPPRGAAQPSPPPGR